MRVLANFPLCAVLWAVLSLYSTNVMAQPTIFNPADNSDITARINFAASLPSAAEADVLLTITESATSVDPNDPYVITLGGGFTGSGVATAWTNFINLESASNTAVNSVTGGGDPIGVVSGVAYDWTLSSTWSSTPQSVTHTVTCYGSHIIAPEAAIQTYFQVEWTNPTVPDATTLALVLTENAGVLDGNDPHTLDLTVDYDAAGQFSILLFADDLRTSTGVEAGAVAALVSGANYRVSIEYSEGGNSYEGQGEVVNFTDDTVTETPTINAPTGEITCESPQLDIDFPEFQSGNPTLDFSWVSGTASANVQVTLEADVTYPVTVDWCNLEANNPGVIVDLGGGIALISGAVYSMSVTYNDLIPNAGATSAALAVTVNFVSGIENISSHCGDNTCDATVDLDEATSSIMDMGTTVEFVLTLPTYELYAIDSVQICMTGPAATITLEGWNEFTSNSWTTVDTLAHSATGCEEITSSFNAKQLRISIPPDSGETMLVKEIYVAGTPIEELADTSCSIGGQGRALEVDFLTTTCVTCPAGTFAESDTATYNPGCLPCPVGNYEDGTGSLGCTQCPAGSRNPSEGSSSSADCVECSLGRYAPNTGSSTCDKCPVGTYGDQEALDACKDCPSGTYLEVTGQNDITDCIDCPVGTFDSSGGSSACDLCSKGEFQDLEGQLSCKQCAIGTHASEKGMDECSACPVGTYADVEGLVWCIECDQGRFLEHEGGVSINECEMCQLGQYAEEGSNVCTSCEKGHYCPSIDKQTPCPAGYEQPLNGQTSFFACTKCNKGEYSLKGDTECSSCPAGRFSGTTPVAECTVCPDGTFSDKTGRTSVDWCDPCTSGLACAGGVETWCGPGQFSGEGASSCSACEIGTFSSKAVNPVCEPCLGGTFNNGTGLSHCDACPGGTYAAQGSTECTTCLKGTFAVAGASVCSDCPFGTIGNDVGASTCEDCGIGRFRDGDTAPSSTTCILCAAGTYSDIVGQSSCQPCALGHFHDQDGQTVCTPCRVGHDTAGLEGATTCVLCEGNTTTSTTGEERCGPCPAGQYKHPLQLRCDLCVAGKFYAGDSAGGLSSCNGCEPGRFVSTTGNTECDACPIGRFGTDFSSTTSSSCKLCPAGEFSDVEGSSSCSSCPSGTFGTNDGTCEVCPLGRYSESGVSSCSLCEMETYSPVQGQTACIDCPQGIYNDQEGSSSCNLLRADEESLVQERAETAENVVKFSSHFVSVGTSATGQDGDVTVEIAGFTELQGQIDIINSVWEVEVVAVEPRLPPGVVQFVSQWDEAFVNKGERVTVFGDDTLIMHFEAVGIEDVGSYMITYQLFLDGQPLDVVGSTKVDVVASTVEEISISVASSGFLVTVDSLSRPEDAVLQDLAWEQDATDSVLTLSTEVAESESLVVGLNVVDQQKGIMIYINAPSIPSTDIMAWLATEEAGAVGFSAEETEDPSLLGVPVWTAEASTNSEFDFVISMLPTDANFSPSGLYLVRIVGANAEVSAVEIRLEEFESSGVSQQTLDDERDAGIALSGVLAATVGTSVLSSTATAAVVAITGNMLLGSIVAGGSVGAQLHAGDSTGLGTLNAVHSIQTTAAMSNLADAPAGFQEFALSFEWTNLNFDFEGTWEKFESNWMLSMCGFLVLVTVHRITLHAYQRIHKAHPRILDFPKIEICYLSFVHIGLTENAVTEIFAGEPSRVISGYVSFTCTSLFVLVMFIALAYDRAMSRLSYAREETDPPQSAMQRIRALGKEEGEWQDSRPKVVKVHPKITVTEVQKEQVSKAVLEHGFFRAILPEDMLDNIFDSYMKQMAIWGKVERRKPGIEERWIGDHVLVTVKEIFTGEKFNERMLKCEVGYLPLGATLKSDVGSGLSLMHMEVESEKEEEDISVIPKSLRARWLQANRKIMQRFGSSRTSLEQLQAASKKELGAQVSLHDAVSHWRNSDRQPFMLYVRESMFVDTDSNAIGPLVADFTDRRNGFLYFGLDTLRRTLLILAIHITDEQGTQTALGLILCFPFVIFVIFVRPQARPLDVVLEVLNILFEMSLFLFNFADIFSELSEEARGWVMTALAATGIGLRTFEPLIYSVKELVLVVKGTVAYTAVSKIVESLFPELMWARDHVEDFVMDADVPGSDASREFSSDFDSQSDGNEPLSLETITSDAASSEAESVSIIDDGDMSDEGASNASLSHSDVVAVRAVAKIDHGSDSENISQ